MTEVVNDLEVPVFATKSWETQPGYTFIADIKALGIDEASSRYVNQGHMVRWTPDSPVRTLMSAGFGKCSAIIVHDPESGNFDFGHFQPMDDPLYFSLLEQDFGDKSETVIIQGSVSTHQHDAVEIMKDQGSIITPIHVETGKSHFHVALDTQTGAVSVIRTSPDQTAFEYRPFTNAKT